MTAAPSGSDLPGIRYLPSWADAPEPFRTCDADGTHHYSQIKKLALSGKQYIHAVNTPFEPTPAMLLGTAVHAIVLGERPGAPVVVYPGQTRQGKAWDEFEKAHEGAEIVTATEWSRAETIAAAVMRDPLALRYLDGARKEVPLAWEDNGIKCSTSGIDIVPDGMIGDLKTTTTVQPEKLGYQARSMHYAEQLCFYRRGCIANGIDVSKGLFLLCVETKAPYEVVPFELTEQRIDVAERTLSLWMEKLRIFTDAGQWPGYTQSPIPLDVEAWERDDEDEEAES